MLNAYLDKGAKEQADGIMCVGAALFKPTPYKRFRRAWEPMLSGWSASAFHATDFFGGGGEFKRSRPDGTIDPTLHARHIADSKRIPIMIGSHVHELFVVSFKQAEFEAVAPRAWRDHYGSLHSIAVQTTVIGIGHWANRVGYTGEIAYFFESGDDDQADVEAGLRRLFDDPVKRRHSRMAAVPLPLEKGRARGLEAADYVAWQWNKFYADTLASAKPRTPRRDIQALMNSLHVHDKKVNVTLFTGDGLENYLIANGCHRKS